MYKIIITLLFCLFTVIVTAQTDTKQPDKVRPLQLGIITPLGTNGIDSHSIVNYVSINLLGGHSYGNYYFEASSLYNINLYFTSGLQAAFIFNWSGKTENAVQAAGIFNAALDGNASMQFGLTFNIARASTLQLGGVFNIAKESTLQLGGVFNIAAESTVQLGGAFNIAKETTFQAAPILNISAGSAGTQISAINIAKEVNGLQFGVINYAEDMNGLPIGLFSFIKNGGKRELAVGFSEGLNTFVSLKSGVNKFYSISSIGINYTDKPIIYGMGIGFGTQIDWTSEWGTQFELIYYDLFEKKIPGILDLALRRFDANSLGQFKVIISRQFNDYFKVFAGPTFNFTMSYYENPNTGEIGTSLSPWSIWKSESEKKSYNFWIGIEGGVSVNL
jgi:hypothetical protein